MADGTADVLASLQEQFGEGAIFRLGDHEVADIETISTRCPTLDLALGINGVPRGRIVEIFGPESAGKTTLVYHIVAEAQAGGGAVAFIDTEHALDPTYAQALGVDTEALLVSQPDYGEQALEIVDQLVVTGEFDVIAVDSVAALVPRVELEGQIGESQVGLHARLMSQAMRKLAGHVGKTRTVVVFTNQLRDNINTLGFGPREVTTGGRALKFYASQRIDVRRIETIKKQGNDPTGIRVRAKIVKNKLAPPFREAEFEIEYGRGISREGCLLDIYLKSGKIKKAGAWYSYEGTRMGQGRDAAKAWLKEHGS